MKQYKEKLKLQSYLLGIGVLLLAVTTMLGIGNELGWFTFLRTFTGDSHWQSAWNGFISGASFGLFSLMLFYLVRNLAALKDDQKLKKLYVKNHDERTNHIVTMARNTAMQLSLWLGLIGTVIAGYFSIAVSITILACTFVNSCLSLLLVGYYNRKL